MVVSPQCHWTVITETPVSFPVSNMEWFYLASVLWIKGNCITLHVPGWAIIIIGGGRGSWSYMYLVQLCFQCNPSRPRCDGQTVIILYSDAWSPKMPTLARISFSSLCRPWELMWCACKWSVTSLVHCDSGTHTANPPGSSGSPPHWKMLFRWSKEHAIAEAQRGKLPHLEKRWLYTMKFSLALHVITTMHVKTWGSNHSKCSNPWGNRSVQIPHQTLNIPPHSTRWGLGGTLTKEPFTPFSEQPLPLD